MPGFEAQGKRQPKGQPRGKNIARDDDQLLHAPRKREQAPYGHDAPKSSERHMALTRVACLWRGTDGLQQLLFHAPNRFPAAATRAALVKSDPYDSDVGGRMAARPRYVGSA